MGYFTGDIPAESLVIEPARNGDPLDLVQFNLFDVVLRSPTGVVIPTSGFTVTVDTVGPDRLLIEWPSESVLTTAGLYTITVTLRSSIESWVEKLPPIHFVVEDITAWHSLESARSEWVQAPSGDLLLYGLLYAAREQVTAYAPAVLPPAAVPYTYRTAQLMQARNIMNAGMVAPGGDIGDESFAIRPYPLDWMIRQMLRPKTGIPVIG